MKCLCLIFCVLFLFPTISFSKNVHVRGGYTKSGSYRQSHYRTSPNRTKSDNWSTKGNVNPYTGKKGYKSAY